METEWYNADANRSWRQVKENLKEGKGGVLKVTTADFDLFSKFAFIKNAQLYMKFLIEISQWREHVGKPCPLPFPYPL